VSYQSELDKSPISVDWDTTIPLKSYPKSSQAALKRYQMQRDIWTSALTTLIEKVANLNQAQLDDAEALRSAIARGEGDPGEIATDKIKREIVVQTEVTRQAREATTEAADAVKAALTADAEELIPLVLENLKVRIETYKNRVAEFEPRYQEDVQGIQSAYSGGSRMVNDALQRLYRCNALGTSLGAMEAVRFRKDAIFQYELRAKQIEEALGLSEGRTRNLSASEMSF
jgi:hypothetical protein